MLNLNMTHLSHCRVFAGMPTGVQGEQIVQKDFWEEFAPAGETLDALQERVKSCISNTYGFAARVQHAESADTLRLRFRCACASVSVLSSPATAPHQALLAHAGYTAGACCVA